MASYGNFTEVAAALTTGDSEAVDAPEGRAFVEVSGTFDSATATVQLRRKATDNVAAGPWLSLGSLADFTADAAQEIAIGSGMEIRVSTTGGGGSQSINCYVSTIDRLGI